MPGIAGLHPQFEGPRKVTGADMTGPEARIGRHGWRQLAATALIRAAVLWTGASRRADSAPSQRTDAPTRRRHGAQTRRLGRCGGVRPTEAT
jgi:hypothetical protein